MKNNAKLSLAIKIILMIIGITFLCLNIIIKEKNNTYLCISLVSIMIVNIMNTIDAKKRLK